MYGKVFLQIFDSSIADDYQLRHFFMDLIVLADSDGVVNMTPTAISARTRIPLLEVTAFLGRLAQPDPESQTPDADGRRIELLDEGRTWGWHIINYAKYREIATEEQRKVKTRERVARFKLKRKQLQVGNAEVTQGNAEVTPPYPSPSSSSSVRVGDQRGRGFPDSIDDALRQCALVTVPKEHIMDCFNKASSRGGVDSRSIPIADFPSFVRIEWKYEQDRRGREQAREQVGNGKLRPHELRAIIEAKESQAADLKNRHCTEVALGSSWSDTKSKQQFFAIKKEIKDIRAKLAAYT